MTYLNPDGSPVLDGIVALEAPKYSRRFWVDLADRAVSTAAQAGLGIATAVSFDLLKPDVPGILAVIGTATLISVLKAFAVARR